MAFEKAHQALVYSHNNRSGSNARGPSGKDGKQWQAQTNRTGAKFANRADGALFRSKKKVLNTPPPAWFAPQPEPESLRPTAEVEPLFGFQRAVDNARAASGPMRLRNPIHMALFLTSLGVVLTPASAADSREHARRSEPSGAGRNSTERLATDVRTFQPDSFESFQNTDMGLTPANGFANSRKVRSAHGNMGPAYNTVAHQGSGGTRHRTHRLKALSHGQRSMLQVIRDSMPDRMVSIGRELKQRGITPDKQYTIDIVTRERFHIKRENVTERADTLVAENHRLINWLQFRGHIPKEIKEIDIDKINETHESDTEQFKLIVASDTSNEIMKGLRHLGFHSDDWVMVHSITIGRASKMGDADQIVTGSKARAFYITARDGVRHWVLLAPDRKEGAIKDFKGMYRTLAEWAVDNLGSVFEKDAVQEFASDTTGTPRVLLWEEGKHRLEAAVNENVGSIVGHVVDREYPAKFHETSGEKMAADFKEHLKEDLIPGYQQYEEATKYGLDVAFGDVEVQLIGVVPGVGAAGREAEQVAVRAVEEEAKRAAKQEGWELAERVAMEQERFQAEARDAEGNLIDQAGDQFERSGGREGASEAGQGAIEKYTRRGLECVLDLSSKRGRRGAGCVAYWHPSFPAGTEVSQSVKQEIDRLKTLIASDSELVKSMKSPAGLCEASLRPTMELARRAGYKPKALGAFLSYGVGKETANNHFATLVEIEGVEYVVDPTVHQFPELGFAGPFIGPRDYFDRTIVSSVKKPVFLYKSFERMSEALGEFHVTKLTNLDPLNPPPGILVKTEATWYSRAEGNAAAVSELEARQEAASRAGRARQQQIRNRAFQNWASQFPERASQAVGQGQSNGVVGRIKSRFSKYVVRNG